MFWRRLFSRPATGSAESCATTGRVTPRGIAVAAVGISCLLAASTLDSAVAATPVTFADSVVQRCVAESLGMQATDQVTDAQAASITSLSCDRVANFGGIGALTNLQTLDVVGATATDFTPVGGLSTLRTLRLSGSGLTTTKAAPLSQLAGLTSLDVSNNSLTDLAFAAPLALTTLQANSNQISDLSGLSGETQLAVLGLNGNKISAVTSLGALTGLRSLDLSVNQIQTVTALGPLTGLRMLALDTNQIMDVSAIKLPAGTLSALGQTRTFIGAPGVAIDTGARYLGGVIPTLKPASPTIVVSGSKLTNPGVGAATTWFETADGYFSATITLSTQLLNWTASPTPTIAGTVKVGQTLTANPGAWSPSPTSFSYQWLAWNTSIAGATGQRYTVGAADLGKTITVRVTANRAGYTKVTKTSAVTVKVVPGSFVAAPNPTISGTSAVGYTLTAVPGTWSPSATYTYQWYRAGVAVSGATASTYKLTSLDRGRAITVKVTGSRTGYYGSWRMSAATPTIR